MPEKRTKARAAKAKRQGKKPSTQAGAYIGEEMRHAKRGKHRVTSRKQAIAIGLSKARRAGVKLTPPTKGRAMASTRRKARRDYARGRRKAA
jgi:hypothetical protein